MKRVTGIGGIFFKANDPDKLREWYRTHLGIEAEREGGAMFKWRDVDTPSRELYTVWSPFPADTDYFAPSEKQFMVNFQVENLDELLTQLKSEGVAVTTMSQRLYATAKARFGHPSIASGPAVPFGRSRTQFFRNSR
jgi:catechol 2,3-dioxygenase-like lactoylglutathione lyase family enzyme